MSFSPSLLLSDEQSSGKMEVKQIFVQTCIGSWCTHDCSQCLYFPVTFFFKHTLAVDSIGRRNSAPVTVKDSSPLHSDQMAANKAGNLIQIFISPLHLYKLHKRTFYMLQIHFYYLFSMSGKF